MLRRLGLVFLFACALLPSSCGKRELPPSPDRWAPKLAGAKAKDRNHVDVLFSEGMDKMTAGKGENYLIVDGDGETLGVRSAELLPDGKTARLTTDAQNSLEYTVQVFMVTDLAGNELRKGSARPFTGSAAKDTTCPLVRGLYPADGSVGVEADTSVRVSFSETMDTSSVSLRSGSVILLPPPVDSSLTWNGAMSAFSFPVASLPSRISSLYVTGGCRDYAGNPLFRSERSVFTTDDSMPGGAIRGRLAVPAGAEPFMCSVVLLDSLSTPLLLGSPLDSTGTFAFSHLSQGSYSIAAACDCDGDGAFDLRCVLQGLTVEAAQPIEDLYLELERGKGLPPVAESILRSYRAMSSLGVTRE